MATAHGTERIEDVSLTTEMQDSYVEYALSVIHARALPDARDGLKPVQRRILYMMSQMGVTPDKGHIKSARVVGEVMGKLHPHGDSAIYDALVRLARPFALSVPLVDGHGNFGSLDDGPAASRYTEARLAAPALLMAQDIDEDVVDFAPNYDNQMQEPTVLPAAFPQLLVNGASGIAVGMATNMPPHNPGEAIQAARHLLRHPQASVEDLMRFLPGPDLPGGGIVLGLDGVREAYQTGRGSFTMRAKAVVERVSARKQGLVITELPYMIGPEHVIQKIKDGVTAKKLSGISGLHDLTDRENGLKMVIEIKTGFDPEAVLAQLYRHTPLETRFGINSVALVNGRPRMLGLIAQLRVFLDHRLQVTRRRSEFRLARCQDRLHLVEGLLIAIVDIDEVIQVIRSSESAEQARGRLQEIFDLSEVQAEYILELRLRRLTRFSQIELETERDDLKAKIATLEALLADPAKLVDLVDSELEATAEKLQIPRRTVLAESPGSAATTPRTARLEDGPTRVFITPDWRLLRQDGEAPEPALFNAETSMGQTGTEEPVHGLFSTTVLGTIGVLTSTGRLLPVPVASLPAVPGTARMLKAGVPAAELAALPRTETVVGVLPLDNSPVAVATAMGVVKRFQSPEPGRPEWQVISLKRGDRLVSGGVANDSDDLILFSSDAHLLRFEASLVRPQGLAASGMRGIALAANAHVCAFSVVPHTEMPEEACVLTGCEDQATLSGTGIMWVKVTPLETFPRRGRGTQGVRVQRFLKGQTQLSIAWAGPSRPQAVDAEGAPVTLPDTLDARDASGQPVTPPVVGIGIPNSRIA